MAATLFIGLPKHTDQIIVNNLLFINNEVVSQIPPITLRTQAIYCKKQCPPAGTFSKKKSGLTHTRGHCNAGLQSKIKNVKPHLRGAPCPGDTILQYHLQGQCACKKSHPEEASIFPAPYLSSSSFFPWLGIAESKAKTGV